MEKSVKDLIIDRLSKRIKETNLFDEISDEIIATIYKKGKKKAIEEILRRDIIEDLEP